VPAQQERLSCRVELRESLAVCLGPVLRRLIAPGGWIDRLWITRRWNWFRGWVCRLLARLRYLIGWSEAAQIIAPALFLSSGIIRVSIGSCGVFLHRIPRLFGDLAD